MAKTPKRVVRATTKYTRTHTKTYNIRCNREYDADIIAFLAEQPNVSGYIKSVLHRFAAEAGYGHLRVENNKPPINPKARNVAARPGECARQPESRG